MAAIWENISFNLSSSCISWALLFFIHYLKRQLLFLNSYHFRKVSLSTPVLQLQGPDIGHWHGKHTMAQPHRRGLRLLSGHFHCRSAPLRGLKHGWMSQRPQGDATAGSSHHACSWLQFKRPTVWSNRSKHALESCFCSPGTWDCSNNRPG